MLSKSVISGTLVLILTLIAGSVQAQRIVYSQVLNGTLGRADDEIGANRFIVYQMNGTPPNKIINIDTDIITASSEVNDFNATVEGAFPDMNALLNFGGTIELVINFGGDGGVENSGYTYASPADVQEFKLVISEIMWGTDAAAEVPVSVQWIEIYNEGAALRDNDDVRLVFYENVRTTDPTVELPTGLNSAGVAYVVVDRVSAVGRFGAKWELKGSSGRSAADAANNVPISHIVSMYRKRSLNAARDGYKYNSKGEPDGDTFKDGTDPDQWVASTGRVNMSGTAFIGSPGSVQVNAGGLAEATKDPNSLPATAVIINEIYNSPDVGDLDWIELHNTGSTDVTISGMGVGGDSWNGQQSQADDGRECP